MSQKVRNSFVIVGSKCWAQFFYFLPKINFFSTEATQGVGYDLMSAVLIGKLISWHSVERRIEQQCINFDSNCVKGCLGALFAASLDANLRGPKKCQQLFIVVEL